MQVARLIVRECTSLSSSYFYRELGGYLKHFMRFGERKGERVKQWFEKVGVSGGKER